jgi:aldehyde dehydrogenase (NAD+)
MNVTTRIAADSLASLFAAHQATALALRLTDAAVRREKLARLDTALTEAADAMRAALAADLGRSAAESDVVELIPIMTELRHTRRHLEGWMRPRIARPTAATLGTAARIHTQPLGASLIISPWNFPLSLALGPLVSAVAAGCPVIIKPSEYAPHSAAVLAGIIAKVFDPQEVTVIEGEAETASALLALPFAHIFFTGSPSVGRIVMQAAAQHLAAVTLELGGKSPAIVDASADIRQAAASLVWGKFINAGQTCIAPDHVYVHTSRFPAFLEAAQSAIGRMFGPGADYARIVSDKHFARLTALLAEAAGQGAMVIRSGADDAATRRFAPTLVTQTPPQARLMGEEIFGPILPIIPYTALAEPIAAINAGPKPLALYIFGKDQPTQARILAETSSGGAAINTTLMQFTHPNLPFGGVNNSGLGAAHGQAGYLAFSHRRAVLTERFSAAAMLRPPYTARTRQLIAMTLRYFT